MSALRDRCPDCLAVVSSSRDHDDCGAVTITEALAGIDVSAIRHHQQMIQWYAGWDKQSIEWLCAVIAAARASVPVA